MDSACYDFQRMSDFERLINSADLELFSTIPSQSTDEDKRSLLACQAAVRELRAGYNYLEIGSHLGGSLQPHLLDPQCTQIYSIDKRPRSQPDARGYDWVYENNSTARMLENLRKVSDDVSKITTIDGDSRAIDPALIEERIDLCFIDGEHTDDAAVADFEFCLKVLSESGVIMFHDSQITYMGIGECLRSLAERSISYRAYVLPHVVFVIEIGDLRLHTHPAVASLLVESGKSFLFALQDNDRYRRFATRFPFGAVRRLLVKLRGGNVSG
jgi:hypothetical protein